MKAATLGLLLLVLGACSHAQLGVRSDARPVNSIASVEVHAGSSLAALILAGMLIDGAAEDLRNPQSAPVMPPDRDISEQDCTKPIEVSGNLRCR